MSTNAATRSTHNGHRQTVQREVAAVFNAVVAAGEQPRLRTVTGTCQFDIAGAGNWYVTLTAGMPTVAEGAQHIRRPDCVVTCDAADFLRIVRRDGGLNLYTAILQGLVKISGDLAFAFTVLSSSTFQRPGADAAVAR